MYSLGVSVPGGLKRTSLITTGCANIAGATQKAANHNHIEGSFGNFIRATPMHSRAMGARNIGGKALVPVSSLLPFLASKVKTEATDLLAFTPLFWTP